MNYCADKHVITAHTDACNDNTRRPKLTGDPLHSRAACTQPCNINTHSRAHCSPGARLCEQWGHGCVNNGARLCASARLCRGSPVKLASDKNIKARVAGPKCEGNPPVTGGRVSDAESVSMAWRHNGSCSLNTHWKPRVLITRQLFHRDAEGCRLWQPTVPRQSWHVMTELKPWIIRITIITLKSYFPYPTNCSQIWDTYW